MGVRGLETYVREMVPGGLTRVNILDEIDRFKEENESAKALIVFDTMGFIHAFGGNLAELLCGGRHNVYLAIMERFCQRLQARGAEMAFFCDGQLTSNRFNEWRNRKNSEYDKSMRLLDEIDRGIPVAHFKTFYGQRTCKKFASGLLLIAKKFGPVIISTDFSCDAAVAQYAVRNNALAVVATDSDNLIFEGDFHYWSATSLDFEELTINRYGRQELLSHLDVTNNELILIASLLGNDYMKINRHLNKFGAPSQHIASIRNYVRMQQVPFRMEDSFLRRICKDLFETKWEYYFGMLRDSIESYDIHFEIPVGQTIDRYASKNVLMSAIWLNGILQYEQNFVYAPESNHLNHNNNNSRSFLEALLPPIKRLAGILLQKRAGMQDNALFKMVIYRNRYELESMQPIYPDLKLPPLEQFFFGENDYLKWTLFMWSLSLNNRTVDDIRSLPKQMLLPVVTLTFMVQQGQLSIEEADMLLVCEFDVAKNMFQPQDIKEPKTLDGRVVRIATLYNKFTTLVEDCLHVCGLEEEIWQFSFDGVYFHALMNMFHRIPRSMMQKRKLMKLRFYTSDVDC